MIFFLQMTNDPVDNLSIKSSESEEDYYDHINRLSKLSKCDQIRPKIQNYLSTKEMTQTAHREIIMIA